MIWTVFLSGQERRAKLTVEKMTLILGLLSVDSSGTTHGAITPSHGLTEDSHTRAFKADDLR